jgi:oligopeptide transport system substrate-binding protein
MIFSGLVEIGAGWEIIPDVAQIWEISENGCRYVFHLRDDVYWSDGTQVTAKDFVYSWIRSLDPTDEDFGLKAGNFFDIKNARGYYKGKISESDQVGVRAIDKLTLEVELERAASYFLQMLINAYPVPSHVVEAHGYAWTDMEHIVTNGAFKIEFYEPGESMSLVRDPTYHKESFGNLEWVEVKLIESRDSLEEIELYERNSVDVAYLNEKTYHIRHKFAEEYIPEHEQVVNFVGFDTSQPPFDDLRVRRAFVMAVDREALANVIYNGLQYPATGGFVPPTIPGHSPGIGLPYDPFQARRLMKEAGYPDGQGFPTLKIVWDRPSMLEPVLAQWLANLNVEVTIEITDWENVLGTYPSRNIFSMGWRADYPDADSFLRVGVRNFFPNWQDESYDQLLEKAQQTMDQSDRIRLYQNADKILIEDAVVMPTTYLKNHKLFKPWVKLPAGGINRFSLKDTILEPH